MSKLKSIFAGIRRSPYQSAVAVLMTTVTFFVVTLFTLLLFGSQKLLLYFESRPQVTAFFQDTATPDSVAALQTQVQDSGLSQSIKYVSKTEALEIYKKQNQDNPLLLEMVTADILPSSLEVSGKSVKDLEGLAAILKADKNVEEVVYQQDVLDTLKKWVEGIRIAGLVLSGLLLLVSLITIIVLLGMRVAARKNEIKTLALLGASSWYIRAPFFAEAILYTSTGVVLGWGTTYLTLLYLTPNLLSFFDGISLLPIPFLFMLAVLGGELVLGLFLGIIASASATRRYRK